MSDAKVKKPIFKRVWFWVVIVLVLAGIGGSMGNNQPKVTTSGQDAASTEAAAASSTTTAAESTEKQPEKDTSKLAIGDSVTFSNKVTVTVNSVDGSLKNYDGSAITCVNVTYSNGGDSQANFNLFDWKGEDAQGAQRSTTIYSEQKEELNSGSLAAGGTVTGNIYFEGQLSKVLYFENALLSKDASATWVLS